MELEKFVAGAGNDAGAAGVGIELDGMAVVDDPQRQRLVVVFDRTDVALDAAAESLSGEIMLDCIVFSA